MWAVYQALRVRSRADGWRIKGTLTPTTERPGPPERPLLPKMSRRPEGATPLCLGRPAEWEDLSPQGSARARSVCRVCPAQEWCATEARRAIGEGVKIAGTWGGVTYAAVETQTGVA